MNTHTHTPKKKEKGKKETLAPHHQVKNIQRKKREEENRSYIPGNFPVSSIRVKWMPKPAPVKRRPPTACRFYFAEFAVPLVYIFVTHPPVLAHPANAPRPRS